MSTTGKETASNGVFSCAPPTFLFAQKSSKKGRKAPIKGSVEFLYWFIFTLEVNNMSIMSFKKGIFELKF